MRGRSRLDADFVETDPHYDIKRAHGRVMIDRLAKLHNAGYRVWIRHVGEGLEIPLIHPDKKAPRLAIWDDGLVNDLFPQSATPDHERNLYEPEDKEGFERFVARLPKPTWLQRVSTTPVGEAWELTIAFVILIGLLWAMSKTMEMLWHAVQGFFR